MEHKYANKFFVAHSTKKEKMFRDLIAISSSLSHSRLFNFFIFHCTIDIFIAFVSIKLKYPVSDAIKEISFASTAHCLKPQISVDKELHFFLNHGRDGNPRDSVHRVLRQTHNPDGVSMTLRIQN